MFRLVMLRCSRTYEYQHGDITVLSSHVEAELGEHALAAHSQRRQHR